MKKSSQLIIAAVVVSGSFASCKKYLDVETPSTISQEAVFNSVSYTNSAVTGVYAMLVGDNGYGNRISCLYPQTADDFKTSGSYSPLDRRGISMYGASSGNTELLNPFRQFYRGIERANICIKYIPASNLYNNGSADQQKTLRRLYGEVLTLRAQFYYELIRNWGDLPFHEVPAADLQDPYLAKTDRDTIYNRIIEDLRVAAELVPWRTEFSEGARISKGAVKALRARIALARGGYSLRTAESKYGQVMARPDDYKTFYQIAYDETKELLAHREQHTLNPTYEDLFLTINSGNRKDAANELMFEIGAFGSNASTDTKLGYYNGLRHNGSSRFGAGGGGINAIATYFYEFDSIGDCRRDVTINSYEIDASSKKLLNAANNMTDGKYRRSWTSNWGTTAQTYGVNWPVIRFADVLLMFAESDNELHNAPSAEGIAAFEEVRRRAFKGYETRMGTTPTDKDGFFKAITQERLLEFGGEGIRKYDLIRWNLMNTKFEETRVKLRQFMNGEGRYANLPLYVYTKAADYNIIASVQEVATLDVYGGTPSKVFFEPGLGSTSAPSGYTVKNWRRSVTEDGITGLQSGFASYFKPNSRELFPLNSDIINENFKLKQDYGY
jgi:starch-binding outer membrane protein, SusD/RagB family